MAKKKSNGDADGYVKKVQPSEPVGDTAPDDSENTGKKPRKGISGLVGGLVNGLSNGLKGAASELFGAKKIGNACSRANDAVANFLHIGKKTSAGLLIGSLVFGGVAGVFAYHDMAQYHKILRSEYIAQDDCVEEIDKMKVSGSEVGDVSGLQEEYAEKAWSVGKAIGLTDEQCAGMLGNMQGESSMDPTTIETIYDEPFNINGAQKSAAIQDLCAFTTGIMRQKYINSNFHVKPHTTKAGCTMAGGGSGTGINSAAYEGTDGHFFPGIGLFGFTGPEGNALTSYAESANMDWWEFDLQMAFIIDNTGGYSRAAWLYEWQSPSSPEDAAVDFNIHFEGNASGFRNDTKAQYARQWYDKFKGSMGDTNYASSILAIADTVQGGSTSKAVAKAEEDCEEYKSDVDNSDLARAAVAYAYKTKELGIGNDGTELYRTVHQKVIGDGIYQSCDRGVTTAIRWSGYDDLVPAGPTDDLDVYFQQHPEKWEKVGEFGVDVQIEDLQPGDILNTIPPRRGSAHGHIVLYVGNEIIKEKYPDASDDAMFVSASLDERSPGCESWYGQFVGDGYYVYRNVQTEENSIYKDVVKGMNLDDGR